MKILSNIFATFLGIGYIPVFPGTCTSAVTVILFYFFLSHLNWPLYLSVLVALFFLGVYFSTLVQKESGQDDPSKVVIDEVVGQLVALFLVPPSWIFLLLAFFIFRFFDIIKPFWIRKTEVFPQGWGIMSDDVAAGIISNLIMQVILFIQ